MLRNSGPLAVPRILQHIGAPTPTDDIQVLVQTLVQMGDQVVPPLLGAIESTNESVASAAIQALGLLQSRQAVPYLLAPAFDPHQPAGMQGAARVALARILHLATDKGESPSSFGAASELRKIARDYLANRIKWPTVDGTTELWTWDEQSKQIVDNRISPLSASLYTGLRFSRQALALSPEDRESQILFLALYFAWDVQGKEQPGAGAAALRTGPGTPLEVALTAGPDIVSDTLGLGLKLQNAAVSLGAQRNGQSRCPS